MKNVDVVMNAVRAFVRASNEVAHEQDLQALLTDAALELGFTQFALGHHVDLARKPADAISLTTYESEWVREALSRDFHRQDPILLASTKTAVGFKWRDIERLIELSDTQRLILERGSAYGLREGFTVPVHIPGEYFGTCSFAADVAEDPTEEVCQAAQLVATFGFEAARRLLRRRIANNQEGFPRLTSRQVDCVTLVAQGKTDWETAQILGLSPDTVHQHVETARRRYKVGKRTQLVIRALFDGQISFSSVMH